MKQFVVGLIGGLALLLAGCPASEEEKTITNYEVLRIEKSNTVVDCDGGEYNKGKRTELQIVTTRREAPRNIIIRNCKINGAIRIAGLGMNGESDGVTRSSYETGHTERSQQNAPSQILIDRVEITGDQRIPIYLSPGVNHVTISNSKITGKSNAVAIYMDAESGFNSLINSTINVQTGQGRELIALDGSANNTIRGNKFQNITTGGIYLYRNCGEGGTVRHQSPQNNLIENNSFDLASLSLGHYGIWLGSRNGNRNYCEDDKGYPFGSSKDNRDFADNNKIIGNMFNPKTSAVRDNGSNNVIR